MKMSAQELLHAGLLLHQSYLQAFAEDAPPASALLRGAVCKALGDVGPGRAVLLVERQQLSVLVSTPRALGGKGAMRW